MPINHLSISIYMKMILEIMTCACVCYSLMTFFTPCMTTIFYPPGQSLELTDLWIKLDLTHTCHTPHPLAQGEQLPPAVSEKP